MSFVMDGYFFLGVRYLFYFELNSEKCILFGGFFYVLSFKLDRWDFVVYLKGMIGFFSFLVVKYEKLVFNSI